MGNLGVSDGDVPVDEADEERPSAIRVRLSFEQTRERGSSSDGCVTLGEVGGVQTTTGLDRGIMNSIFVSKMIKT